MAESAVKRINIRIYGESPDIPDELALTETKVLRHLEKLDTINGYKSFVERALRTQYLLEVEQMSLIISSGAGNATHDVADDPTRGKTKIAAAKADKSKNDEAAIPTPTASERGGDSDWGSADDDAVRSLAC